MSLEEGLHRYGPEGQKSIYTYAMSGDKWTSNRSLVPR